ncbi:hypothetical protein SAMN05446037_1003187 [Anaerovirgula multivorans]|uniref:Uncharacterized protein n=1 Tax=Anaerovirgula multivorans TaxID=312168 RepID=A0A239BE57_9FIRM|nr:hypothetical protein [Anaerovirgula multivorans]SNS05841.1 hypothetical protein SAMN05446037_1003187 [Anaerovirgula multivorans]
MSIRKSQWTNIKGDMREYSARTYKYEERHFHREAKSQKAQLESMHDHGIRKDVKTPMKRKLT